MFGPQLPLHLLKRKSRDDDEEDETRRSDDDQGPQPQPATLPKPTKSRSDRNKDNHESSSTTTTDSFGPQLPPHLMARKKQEPSTSVSASSNPQPTTTRRRVMGPAAPPPPSSNRGRNDDDEDDDDDIGPQPIPEEYAGVMEEIERQRKLAEIEARASKRDDDDKNTAPQRGEWMLVPPEVKRLNWGPQMASRQFSKTTKPGEVDQSGWTALPGERVKNDDNKKRRTEVDHPPAVADLETLELVKSHNEKSRPKSLMEIHSKEYIDKGKYDEDNVANRRFDRDKDLTSRRVDAKSRQNMIQEAKNLDGRFSHGRKQFL
ncbi:hypothetical protein HDU76_009882 [Blyttiomyces sp. JEL0837]|nr:hypothetical protein HDU76_009882 [Blyttiomyces sp. JEL0837]